VRDFLVPSQVNWTRQAAIVVRSRSPGVVLLSVADRPLAERVSMRSSSVLMVPPVKKKGGRPIIACRRDWERTRDSDVDPRSGSGEVVDEEASDFELPEGPRIAGGQGKRLVREGPVHYQREVVTRDWE
jgi:hypothetical protein